MSDNEFFGFILILPPIFRLQTKLEMSIFNSLVINLQISQAKDILSNWGTVAATL